MSWMGIQKKPIYNGKGRIVLGEKDEALLLSAFRKGDRWDALISQVRKKVVYQCGSVYW